MCSESTEQDPAAVDMALTAARNTEDRPSLIVARTHIGYGSPHKQDTWHAHGEPLGVEEVRLTKQALGWPDDRDFYVPEDARRQFRTSVERGEGLEVAWQRRVEALQSTHPTVAAQFASVLAGHLPDGWEAHLPVFGPADGEMATRDAAGAVLNALAGIVTNLVGGSADLDPSTRTAMKGFGDFESPAMPDSAGELPTQGTAGGVWGYAGRNIHFGLREHAMAAVMTGMALHDGLLPYGATFLSFSDYMRPSIRLAALSKAHVIYIWTHDSIALGERGCRPGAATPATATGARSRRRPPRRPRRPRCPGPAPTRAPRGPARTGRPTCRPGSPAGPNRRCSGCRGWSPGSARWGRPRRVAGRRRARSGRAGSAGPARRRTPRPSRRCAGTRRCRQRARGPAGRRRCPAPSTSPEVPPGVEALAGRDRDGGGLADPPVVGRQLRILAIHESTRYRASVMMAATQTS